MRKNRTPRWPALFLAVWFGALPATAAVDPPTVTVTLYFQGPADQAIDTTGVTPTLKLRLSERLRISDDDGDFWVIPRYWQTVNVTDASGQTISIHPNIAGSSGYTITPSESYYDYEYTDGVGSMRGRVQFTCCTATTWAENEVSTTTKTINNYLTKTGDTMTGPLTLSDRLVFQATPDAPTSPVSGTMYFDSDDSNLYVYNGSSWDDLTAGGTVSGVLSPLALSSTDVSLRYSNGLTVSSGHLVADTGSVSGTVAAGDDSRFLTATQKTDLTDSGESTLHYHDSDRNRSNHTGTQTRSTISDFSHASDHVDGTDQIPAVLPMFLDPTNGVSLRYSGGLTVTPSGHLAADTGTVSGTVAAGDHTHTEVDITDLDHPIDAALTPLSIDGSDNVSLSYTDGLTVNGSNELTLDYGTTATQPAAGDHTHAHSAITGIGTDDHHARDHAARHLTGGGDALTLQSPLTNDSSGISLTYSEGLTLDGSSRLVPLYGSTARVTGTGSNTDDAGSSDYLARADHVHSLNIAVYDDGTKDANSAHGIAVNGGGSISVNQGIAVIDLSSVGGGWDLDVDSDTSATYTVRNSGANEAGVVKVDDIDGFAVENGSGTEFFKIDPDTSNHVALITGGTLGGGKSALRITATNADTAAVQDFVNLQLTTNSGGNPTQVDGLNVELLAGGTDSIGYYTLRFINAVAGTGTSGWNGGAGNYGLNGSARGTTSGHNVALFGGAYGSSSLNVAVAGLAGDWGGTGDMVGVYGWGDTAGAQAVGGLFVVDDNTPAAYNVDVDSALIADNMDNSVNIATFRDNTVTKVAIVNGGQLQLSNDLRGLSDTDTGLNIGGDGAGTANQVGLIAGSTEVLTAATSGVTVTGSLAADSGNVSISGPSFVNLRVDWQGVATVGVRADAVTLFRGLTNEGADQFITVHNVSITADTFIDSEAADTHYAVVLHHDGATLSAGFHSDHDAFDGLSGLSDASYRRVVGSVLNDSGSDFRRFWQRGEEQRWTEAVEFSALSSTSITDLDASGQIPPNSQRMLMKSHLAANTTENLFQVNFYLKDDGGGYYQMGQHELVVGLAEADAGITNKTFVEVFLNSSQGFAYKVHDTKIDWTGAILGCRLDL